MNKTITNFPRDLIREIIDYLDVESVISLYSTSRFFRDVITSKLEKISDPLLDGTRWTPLQKFVLIKSRTEVFPSLINIIDPTTLLVRCLHRGYFPLFQYFIDRLVERHRILNDVVDVGYIIDTIFEVEGRDVLGNKKKYDERTRELLTILTQHLDISEKHQGKLRDSFYQISTSPFFTNRWDFGLDFFIKTLRVKLDKRFLSGIPRCHKYRDYINELFRLVDEEGGLSPRWSFFIDKLHDPSIVNEINSNTPGDDIFRLIILSIIFSRRDIIDYISSHITLPKKTKGKLRRSRTFLSSWDLRYFNELIK